MMAEAAQDLILPAQLNMLRDAAAPSTALGMALLRELLRLHRLFEEAQILVIPYKGPILASVAYEVLFAANTSDLDFIL